MPKLPDSPVVLPVPGTLQYGQWKIEARYATFPSESKPLVVATAPVDVEYIVRKRIPGDRFRLPLHKTERKLKDIFNRLGIPPELRDQVPLVSDKTNQIVALLTPEAQSFYILKKKQEKQVFIGLFINNV